MPAENGVRSDAYEPSADECHDSVQRGEPGIRGRGGVLVDGKAITYKLGPPPPPPPSPPSPSPV